MVHKGRSAGRQKRDRAARVISATAAAKAFGGLVDRVRDERAVYVIERGGTPVARIAPIGPAVCTIADLAELLAGRPPLDAKYLDEVETGQKSWNRPALPGDRWTS